MISSTEVVAVLVALLVAGVAAPPAARLRRRVLVRRPVSSRGRAPRRRREQLVDSARRAATRLAPSARRRPSAEAVATWCDGIGRRVRAGSTLRDALVTTETSSPALAAAVGEIQHGLERGEPIEVALDRRGPSDGNLGLGLAVIGATARLGGPSSQALDRVAAALRLRAADEHERLAHSSQARMSAHVLTLVPLGFLGLMLTVDDGVRDAVTAPTGAAIVGAGLLLNGLGWLWMRAVIGRAPG